MLLILNYIFLLVLFLFSTLMVLFTTNPVYGVFFLILSFVLVAFFYLFIGIDLIGIFIIILYVGAIAVLFLFILMMLNVKTFDYYSNKLDYLYIALCVILSLFYQIYNLNYIFSSLYGLTFISLFDSLYFFDLSLNSFFLIDIFGDLFYTYFFLYFLLIGFVLLLTMVGAISLTLNHNLNVRRQITYIQISRTVADSIVLR